MEFTHIAIASSGETEKLSKSNILMKMFRKIKNPFHFTSLFKRRSPNDGFVGRREEFGKQSKYGFKKSLGALRNVVVVLISVGIVFALYKFVSENSQSALGTRVEIPVAKATQNINKELTLSIKDTKGEEVGKIKYFVEKAELQDEIIVKGQTARAVAGKEFLIVTLKIVNEHKEPIKLNSRDYLRLSINGNENDWLAPEIHNDPVEIQAISTKFTRVGFTISDSDSNLKFRLGEINGQKETIELNFN